MWGILIPQGIENGGVGSTLIRGFAWTDPCILKWNNNKVVKEKDDVKIENINKQIEKVDGKIQKDDKKVLMLIIVRKGN